MIYDILAFCNSSMPSSEEDISGHVKKVREYLGPIRDFDDLISP